MSTQKVAFTHPFSPDETLTGERLGQAFRDTDPYPYGRVRVGDTTLIGPESDIR